MISTPLTRPHFPNLALEKLTALGQRSGLDCRAFYSSLLLPRSLAVHAEAPFAPAFFSPYYYGVDKRLVADELATRLGSMGGPDRLEDLAATYLQAIDAVSEWFEGSKAWLATREFDIAAFSVGFDAQRLASALLARHIKSVRASTTVVFGGTACDDDMGRETLRLFDEVDVVYQGEAESTFVDLMRRIAEGRIDDLPAGALTRGSGPPAEDPPYTSEFANVVPNYSSFVEQRSESEYAEEPLILLFESSRGCWWGRRSHCKFCGIRNVSGPYRRASVEGVASVYHELRQSYNPDILYATDAILDFRYFAEFFVALSEFNLSNGAPMLFYEVKPTLDQGQLAQLAAAGVRAVQPGIEAFSTAMLKKLGKGGNALLNVRFLRNAKAYSINVVYGLLYGSPDETIEDVEDSIRIIEKIRHLPPPTGAHQIVMHENSPYAKSPETYGIDAVYPFWYQRLIYQTQDDEVLLRVCYENGFSSPMLRQAGLGAAHERLVAAVEIWRARYARGDRLLLFRDRGRASFLVRYLDGQPHDSVDFSQAESLCYDACSSPRGLRGVATQTGLEREAAAAALARLVDAGGLIHERDRYLAVAEEPLRDPWADAGIVTAGKCNIL